MSDTRLIERWLPIAEIGEESVRERTLHDGVAPDLLPACLVGAASARGFACRNSCFVAPGGCGPREVHARARHSWRSREGKGESAGTPNR